MTISHTEINLADRTAMFYYSDKPVAKNQAGTSIPNIIDGSITTGADDDSFHIDLQKVYLMDKLRIRLSMFPIDISIKISADDSTNPVTWVTCTATKTQYGYEVSFSTKTKIRHIAIYALQEM